MFVASSLSINRKSSIRFAWWVHISGAKHYDGKRQVSLLVRFKMCPIKKTIKIDRDIGKKPSLGCHLLSFQYGDHTLGFQIKGRETIALVFTQPLFFSFFPYWQTFAIKSMFCPKWHLLGLIFARFRGAFFSIAHHLIFVKGKKKRYVIPSALAIMAGVDFFFGS